MRPSSRRDIRRCPCTWLARGMKSISSRRAFRGEKQRLALGRSVAFAVFFFLSALNETLWRPPGAFGVCTWMRARRGSFARVGACTKTFVVVSSGSVSHRPTHAARRVRVYVTEPAKSGRRLRTGLALPTCLARSLLPRLGPTSTSLFCTVNSLERRSGETDPGERRCKSTNN